MQVVLFASFPSDLTGKIRHVPAPCSELFTQVCWTCSLRNVRACCCQRSQSPWSAFTSTCSTHVKVLLTASMDCGSKYRKLAEFLWFARLTWKADLTIIAYLLAIKCRSTSSQGILQEDCQQTLGNSGPGVRGFRETQNGTSFCYCNCALGFQDMVFSWRIEFKYPCRSFLRFTVCLDIFKWISIGLFGSFAATDRSNFKYARLNVYYLSLASVGSLYSGMFRVHVSWIVFQVKALACP